MRFSFLELPGDPAGYPRPVVPVAVEGSTTYQQCLIDTGALHNRFARWLAEAVGLDLTDGRTSRIALGGTLTDGVTVPVRLAIGDAAWQAPVTFCDPWPAPFQLLGQEGFLRFFRVTIRAASYTLDCDPENAG